MSGQASGQTGFQRERLNDEINRLGLTNDELAASLGIPERSIRRWRKGEANPRRRTAHRLAEHFGRDLSWFYIDHQGDEAAA